MAYLGSTPARAPLSSAQIEDGTIATADIADDAVTTAKIDATDLVLTNSASITGATPTLTIGDAGAEDTKIVFDGNAQDYYIGLDDSADDLLIGLGSTVGTTPAIAIDENLDIVTSGVIKTTVAHDGGDTSITINNSAGSGSTDETATLAFQHAGVAGGKIVSTREGDYSGSNNNYSKMQFHITRAASDVLAMQFDSATDAVATFLGGETTNANNTGGLTINQQARDDEIISLKSSDVAHGLTSYTETDTFLAICKGRAANGGGGIKFFHENTDDPNPSYLMFYGGTASTGKTTSNYGLFWQDVHEHDGSNGLDSITANGNCYSWHAQSGGTANRTLMILDEDGDLHVDGSSSLTAFDAWDDAALLRSLELWREGETEGKLSDQMLKSRYDANKYTKEQLALAKVIQVVEDEDWEPTGPDANQSLVNTGAIGRITTGAVWQNHEMLDAIIETMEERDSGFTAALKKKFVARGLPTQILDWTGDIPDDLKKPDVAPKAFNAE